MRVSHTQFTYQQRRLFRKRKDKEDSKINTLKIYYQDYILFMKQKVFYLVSNQIFSPQLESRQNLACDTLQHKVEHRFKTVKAF